MKSKVVIGLSILILVVLVGLGIFAATELSDRKETTQSKEYCYVVDKYIREGDDLYCLDIAVEGTDIEKSVNVTSGVYNNVEIGSTMKCLVSHNSDGSVGVELVK